MQERAPEQKMPEEKASKTLSPQASRALAEAAERRRSWPAEAAQKEIGGRGGLDPARFGDWEAKGIAHDF